MFKSMLVEKPSERFELSTPGLQDQCSNPWATKALLIQRGIAEWLWMTPPTEALTPNLLNMLAVNCSMTLNVIFRNQPAIEWIRMRQLWLSPNGV